MSCATLSSQTVRMNVSVGALPEGFCPKTMQELAQAIVDRLIVTPNQAFSSFAAGSIPPASNVGPWLKDCLEWWVFDDATATYVPISKGFSNQQNFSVSGNFVVPQGVFKIMVEGWGGGGGGTTSDGGTGGGGGGYGTFIKAVTPAQLIPFTIGTGGAPNSAGGNTTILGMTANGGASGAAAESVAGGTVTGADFSIQGGYSFRPTTGLPTMGGSSPRGGSGGTYHPTLTAYYNGLAPGGGGGGAHGANSGTGGNGAIVIWY